MDRAAIVHENFLRRVAEGDLPPGRAPGGPLASAEAVSIYRSGCLTRALDRTSRAMQAAGQGFYTIGSAGHETGCPLSWARSSPRRCSTCSRW